MVVLWIWYVILDLCFAIVRVFTNPLIPILYNTRFEDKIWLWLPNEYSIDYKWFDTFYGYDWDKHYESVYKESLEINEKYHLELFYYNGVKCIDDNFTRKEKVLRYFSRLIFLYKMSNRTNFSFTVTGLVYNSNDNMVVKSKDFIYGDFLLSIINNKNTPYILRPFMLGLIIQYSKDRSFAIHLGWETTHFNDNKVYLAKIIYKIRPFQKTASIADMFK